jgi:hypothetical protein
VSKAVQLAEAIAESCGDTELLEVLERPAYQLALGGENSLLAGRFGSSNWQSVGAEAAGSWQWIAERLRQHISWVGDASVRDAGAVLQSNPAPAPWVADSYGYRQAFPGGVPDEALPSRTPTVLITLFFGLFGIIPAAVATSQARASRVNTGRYWAAFGWTLVLSVVVWFVFVMLVAGLALSAGSG